MARAGIMRSPGSSSWTASQPELTNQSKHPSEETTNENLSEFVCINVGCIRYRNSS
jgi:hypothetical protein